MSAIDHASYVYPNDDTKSTFFKSYTPARVTQPFQRNYTSYMNSSGSSSAGKKFATHREDWNQHFVIANDRSAKLTADLRNDVLEKLAEQGAQVTGEARSNTGLEIRYEVGNTRGAVGIRPLQTVDPKTVVGAVAICKDERAVMLQVQVSETWSKLQPTERIDWPTLSNL